MDSSAYLTKIGKECIQELNDIGIKTGSVYKWVVNSRAKKRWGLCRYYLYSEIHENCCYEIEISGLLLRDDTNIHGLKQTVMHELLHTCEGCMNHGKEWKRLADNVNKTLGYSISRLNSCDGVGLSEAAKEERDNNHRYTVQCKTCGHNYYHDRFCGCVKNPDIYRCKCGGKLKVICNIPGMTIYTCRA